jgi:hypothetical protein
MNTATTMTAADLYAADSTMRALVAAWNEHCRCPLPLVDFLLENGLDSQAEAARWAATKELRPVSEAKDSSFSFPCPNMDGSNYVWAGFNWRSKYARDFPTIKTQHLFHEPGMTEAVAILWLLDNWQVKA